MQDSQKTFSLYEFSGQYFSVWCQKKDLHCIISWRPRTTFLIHFETKCRMRETVEWEKGRYFAYMATPSCYVISKEVESPSLGTTEFLDPLVYINNSHWQSSRIIIFWCKYDIVISDILVGYFLDKLFFLLTLISLEHCKKPRRKDWVTEKST